MLLSETEEAVHFLLHNGYARFNNLSFTLDEMSSFSGPLIPHKVHLRSSLREP